jgi:epoxyqueuosine reductase QueG
MENILREEIVRFVQESRDNRFPDSDLPYFEEPLIGFAAADDPLFGEYKKIIGGFHLTPAEIMKNTYGDRIADAVTVICWILPISAAARESNRMQDRMPSREWALTRAHGEQFNTLLRMHLVDMLTSIGARAVAPLLSGLWRPVMDPEIGMASTWSERHAAYTAGLGTFSLSDGFITEKGIAHRCGSVVTDVAITPSRRSFPDHLSNCLFYRDGSCGACIRRCPAGAISPGGHDKERCRAYAYDELRIPAAERYGVLEAGCGLCQTKVPCESCIPDSWTGDDGKREGNR